MIPTNKQDSIRQQDEKMNALSRLVDSLIIIFTLWAVLQWYGEPWVPLHFWVLFFSICAFTFFSDANASYKSWRNTSLTGEIGAVLSSWIATCLCLVFVGLLYQGDEEHNRWVLVVWFVLTPLELLSWHAILKYIFHLLGDSSAVKRNVAIAGATPLGLKLSRALDATPWSGFRFVGFYDDRDYEPGRRLKDDEADPIRGNYRELVLGAKSGDIDIVFMALPLKAEDRLKDLTEKLSDSTASVYMMLDMFSFDLMNAKSLDIEGMPAVSICETPHSGMDQFVKRVFDIVVSSMILLLIAIPMIFIAAGVKLSSPGPVLFKQKRYGVNGERIDILKFRSMKVMEDGDGKLTQVTKDDDRVTPFGRFLRRTSLDELPQFFNVLAGCMSIVGPRPHAVSHNEEYRAQIKRYMLRHKVKPGITGLAQVNGFRGETETLDKMEGRIRYDLEYIKNWSVMLDLRILIETIFKGFKNPNAY